MTTPPGKIWRYGLGVGVGAASAYVLHQLGRLFLLYAGDAVPKLTQHWSSTITLVAVLASGTFGFAVLLFVGRAGDGPALLLRTGASVMATGLVVAIAGGLFFFLMPAKPALHPGRSAAGDSAAAVISIYVLSAGVLVAVVAGLIVAAAFVWRWRRVSSGGHALRPH